MKAKENTEETGGDYRYTRISDFSLEGWVTSYGGAVYRGYHTLIVSC